MPIGIGATLRKARNRRKVGLSEVEAATKIRARFLAAIEEEAWELLPGDVYARGFIRAYGAYLGLDGERLAAEYASRDATAAEDRGVPVRMPAQAGSAKRARSRARGGFVAVAAVVAFAGLAVAIGLLAGDGDQPLDGSGSRAGTVAPPSEQPESAGLLLELTATAEVWVCLLDARDRPLVDGRILAAGAEEGPFRSGSFTVSLGNGEVSMTIDGQEAEIPETPNPVGYAVGGAGRLEPLAESERPDCA